MHTHYLCDSFITHHSPPLYAEFPLYGTLRPQVTKPPTTELSGDKTLALKSITFMKPPFGEKSNANYRENIPGACRKGDGRQGETPWRLSQTFLLLIVPTASDFLHTSLPASSVCGQSRDCLRIQEMRKL